MRQTILNHPTSRPSMCSVTKKIPLVQVVYSHIVQEHYGTFVYTTTTSSDCVGVLYIYNSWNITDHFSSVCGPRYFSAALHFKGLYSTLVLEIFITQVFANHIKISELLKFVLEKFYQHLHFSKFSIMSVHRSLT